jgi:hypothetical protein
MKSLDFRPTPSSNLTCRSIRIASCRRVRTRRTPLGPIIIQSSLGYFTFPPTLRVSMSSCIDLCVVRLCVALFHVFRNLDLKIRDSCYVLYFRRDSLHTLQLRASYRSPCLARPEALVWYTVNIALCSLFGHKNAKQEALSNLLFLRRLVVVTRRWTTRRLPLRSLRRTSPLPACRLPR